jgi:hypothetical protein
MKLMKNMKWASTKKDILNLNTPFSCFHFLHVFLSNLPFSLCFLLETATPKIRNPDAEPLTSAGRRGLFFLELKAGELNQIASTKPVRPGGRSVSRIDSAVICMREIYWQKLPISSYFALRNLMNIPQNNPAGRLYVIFNAAKAQDQHSSVKSVWTKVFELPTENLPAIFYRLAILLAQVDEAEKALRLLTDISPEIWLQDFPIIKKVLSPSNFDESWQRTKQEISDAVMRTLSICADRLSRSTAEPTVEDSQISDLRAEVESLFKSIEASDLAADLKGVLLDMTEGMLRALNEYRIRGISGLRAELFNIVERFQKNFDLLKRNGSDSLVQRFWQLASRYETISTVMVNTPELISKISNLLQ